MKEIILKVDEKDKGMRLDIYLLKNALKRNLEISRTGIQKAIALGKVISDIASLKPHHKIRPGEVFKIRLEEKEAPSKLESRDIALDIIYQDEDLAVINKPSGLVVHPGAGNQDNTLVNILLYHMKVLSNVNPDRPGIVHRLDKDASGLMVIAKNNKSHAILTKQFAKHTVKRQYVALVKGNIEFDEDIIELPISRHIKDRKKMCVGFGRKARYAKTHYRTLIRTKQASLIKLSPFTGRTHQLRVHLTFIGHPILGDIKYGKNNAFSRLALHAMYIGFFHPSTNKFMEFSTPIPEEFLDYIKKIKKRP